MTCCCDLCIPNMIVAKANEGENLGEFVCLSITKGKAKTNPLVFICNDFCADGRYFLLTVRCFFLRLVFVVYGKFGLFFSTYG